MNKRIPTQSIREKLRRSTPPHSTDTVPTENSLCMNFSIIAVHRDLQLSLLVPDQSLPEENTIYLYPPRYIRTNVKAQI